MKFINEDKYIYALENALRKATKRNKEKIEEIIQRDYIKGIISKEIYEKANKITEEYFKENYMRTKVKTIEYNTIEELERKMGVKIEGHRYRKIEGLEDEER